VANEAMTRPIRSLTQARGFNPKNHILSVFGGAGAQHACSIAKDLGISKILVHKYCGILSAYGLGLADVVKDQETPYQQFLDSDGIIVKIKEEYHKLQESNNADLLESGFDSSHGLIKHHKYLNLRYFGTDTSIMVQSSASESDDGPDYYQKAFEACHKREFGFNFD